MAVNTTSVLFDVTDKHADRLLGHVSHVTSAGCWEWGGNKHAAGYGVLNIDGHRRLAHRASYRYFRGEIPEGLVIDHKCRNRACVNPWHMEVVTIGENVMRGETIAARNVNKTECANGHPYSGDNLFYGGKNGRTRYCRQCSRDRQTVYNRRNRAALRGASA